MKMWLSEKKLDCKDCTRKCGLNNNSESKSDSAIPLDEFLKTINELKKNLPKKKKKLENHLIKINVNEANI